MAYHLQNIETLEYFNCDEVEWIKAIETAKENYWEPDGTVYDIYYDAADQTSDDDLISFYFTLINLKSQASEWNGSYTEKRNQVVIYEDSIYLAAALDGTGTSIELIEFIRKGSFRICAD